VGSAFEFQIAGSTPHVGPDLHVIGALYASDGA